jgi:hypothetical protein
VTIVATPDISSTPPSVEVVMSLAPGSVMSSIDVYRNDSAGRSLLRTQPVAGFDSRTVTDIECPYGESVTYYWETTYTTSFTTDFAEAWASAAAWTVFSGAVNVSGGKVRNTPTGTLCLIYRAVTRARHRITIDSMETNAGGYVSVSAVDSVTGDTFRIQISGGLLSASGPGSFAYLTIDPAQPIVIDFLSDSISIAGTGGSASLVGGMLADTISIDLQSGTANASRVGAIEVETYGSETTLAETSDPVTLDPADAWLIHPASPDLSVPMTNTVTLKAGIRAIGEVVNPTNATKHTILGSKTKVTTTTGPRGDDETSMTIWTYTQAESAAMKALLAGDIPILIQVPPSWEFDFACGYYSVGDAGAARELEDLYQGVRSREWRLPLTKTVSPVVDVENTGWSWAALAVELASWTEEKSTFATWSDLAANNRS